MLFWRVNEWWNQPGRSCAFQNASFFKHISIDRFSIMTCTNYSSADRNNSKLLLKRRWEQIAQWFDIDAFIRTIESETRENNLKFFLKLYCTLQKPTKSFASLEDRTINRPMHQWLMQVKIVSGCEIGNMI